MENFTLFRSDTRTNKTKRWLGLLTFCMMLFGYQSFAQVQVGYSTTTTTYNVPFQNLWGYSWTQSIYTAQELSADAGNITAIQYYYSGASALNTMGDFTMYIGHTTKNSFDSTATTEWIDVADLEQVFTGGVTASEAGWITITLDAPFAYDGISNLVIAIDENQASYTSSQTFRYSETAPNRTMQYRSDSTNPDPAAPPVASTRFGYVANTVFVGLTSNLVIPTCLDALPTFAETSTGCGNLGGTLTWAAPATGYVSGYKVYIGTSSGNYDVVDGNMVTTLSYNLSTTLADTTYYYKIVPTNPAGDAENCVEGTFVTSSSICYCIPTGGANNADEILNFTLNNLNNTSAPSEGTAGYSDYTTTVAPAIIPAGIPTIASLTSGTGSGNHGAAIWIDYNQNGTFEESEKVTFIGLTIAASTTVSFPAFTVPVSVTPGNYRLRVQYRWNTGGATLDPCVTTTTFTETEDYLVNITEAPSCLPPVDVTASNPTANSVDIAWVSTGTIFDIKWGLPGFDVETEGTLVTNFTSGGTLSGLDPITTYQFYIRQDCGDGDISMWAGPYSFTTTCAILVPPTATEDFTGYTGTAPATLPCWSEATGTLDNPLTGTTSLWTNQVYNTNINSSHPFGTAAYINLYSSNRNEWLITPAVDLGDGTIPYQMEYDVSITPWTGTADVTALGNSFVQVVVSTDGGETWSSTNVLHTYDDNDIPTGGGREDALPLTGYSGIVKFAFYAHSEVLTGTPDVKFYIDNWKVIPVPTCPKPTFFGIDNITSNSVDLSWVSTGTTFDVIWGEVGFDVATEGTLVPNFVSGQTLTGLSPVTTYQVYVRQNCGNGDVSPWTSPLTFTTLCGALIPPTATEDFTGYTGTAPTTLPCWSEATGTLDNPLTGTTSTWTSQTYNTNINSAHPFGTAAYINLYGADNEWLISPAVDLGDGTIPYQLEYDVSITPWTGVGPLTDMGEKFVSVVISTDDGATWSSTNVLHTYDNNDIPAGGREDALPLTGYSGIVKFAFYAHSTSTAIDTRFYIDNWRVVPVPTCPKPTFLGVSNITFESAELTWTSTGTLFDIEYGEAGFTPTGTPSIGLTGVAHPYTLTGLTAETSYQYYVRQDCGDGDISTWAGPYTFYTGYCLATSTGTSYRITGFSTTDGYTNITNESNGTSNGYSDFTDMVVTQSELGTFNYSISVPANTVVDIWIDIDHNLIFDPIDELLGSFTDYQSTATVYSGSFTIPPGLPLGDYRMRVRSRYYNNAANPCGTAANGETEDYTLTIIETPTCMPPTGLGAENISYDSADLFWTLVDGNGTSFDIEYGEAGFIPTETPSTGLVGVANPYTLTGLTPLTTYEYYVRQNCGGINGESIWVGPFSFSTECLPPAMPVTTGGSVCGLGEVTLAATADAGTTIAWYDSETGGTKLGEGETFVTPEISETTSYWAATYTGGGTEYVGPATPSIGAGGYTTSLTYVTFFTVTNATTIESVDIFINTTATMGATGSIVINDLTNGGVVGTYTYTVEQTGLTEAQTVIINQPLPPGNYSMGMANTNISLYRNTAGASFPYIGTDISITGQGFTGFPEYYYYFYNWAIASGCYSDRTEVIATVTAPPALELSTNEISICAGETPDTVTITTGASDYDTFVWEPSTGVTGDATTGWAFAPTETTTYTLTASQNSGAECTTVTTVEIVVNPLPSAITVVGDEQACIDSISALSVEGNIVNGTAVFGTGTTAPGATAWPNPLSAFYGGTKHQMLYTASELADQGLIAGSEITAVTFDMATVNTTNGALVDFTIRMGSTTVTEMTGLLTGTSDVYGPSTFTPSTVGVGIVSFTLTTPYVWDGVSNLIVETVHNSGNSGNGSGTTTRTSPTPHNSVYRVAKDNVAGGISGFDSTTFTVVGAHNIRPNMTFVHSMEQTMITWAPATNLYTDATATVPYVSGEYAQVVYFKPTEQGSVTYTATSSTEFDCTVSDAITITVGAAIVAPTGDTTQTLDDGDTLADLIVTGSDLVWYADADLTQVIADTTPAVNGTTYYVVSESAACQSAALAITVIIDPCAGVTTPTGATEQSLLLGQNIAGLTVAGNNLVWYSDEDLTVEIPNTTVAVDGTTYYVVSETDTCQSDALAITVTVIDPCAQITTPTGDANQTLEEGDTLADLVVDGDNLAWYSDADLTISIPATTVAQDGVTYYVASVTDICQSEGLAITVTISMPDPCEGVTVPAPTGEEIQTLTEGQTLADLIVEGENLQWYADADLTESLEETHVAEETTYYVTQTIGVCTGEALAVTVEFTVGREDFESFAFRFYPNPVGDVLNLTSNVEISNIDLFNMLGQKVTVVANTNNTQVDMSGLPTGNYIISVTIEGITKTFKVVKN